MISISTSQYYMAVLRLTVTFIQTSRTISVIRTGWWIFVTSVEVSINSWCVDLCLLDSIYGNVCSYCEMAVESVGEYWLAGTFCSSITVRRFGVDYKMRPVWLPLWIVARTCISRYIILWHQWYEHNFKRKRRGCCLLFMLYLPHVYRISMWVLKEWI